MEAKTVWTFSPTCTSSRPAATVQSDECGRLAFGDVQPRHRQGGQSGLRSSGAMGDTLPGTRLHVTSNEQEMLGDLPVHQNLAKNAATFLHRRTSHDQLCIP
ncbi:hypothetical protein [Streptomyces sp. ZS0098]|uniref:hypothetical protein n=1 Tax=Streptomyces sp. ZS0098 TaxID=1904044 RepID=UPI00217E1A26|nr:hypothetical protein [Streptomyces sp. ZS0098]